MRNILASFLLVALSAIAASAADYYLEGTFNNWTAGDTRYAFTANSDGSYTLDFNGRLNSDFLVNDGTAIVMGSNSASLIPGKPYRFATGTSAEPVQLFCAVQSAVITINPARGTIIVQPKGVKNLPSGYYSALVGKSDAELKTAASNATVFTVVSQSETYSALPTSYKRTDVYPGTEYWWDMYSDINTDINLVFGNKEAQGGGDMNREHSMPKSWWGGTSVKTTAYCDLNHLYPSKAAPNNAKSDHPLGVVATASYDNGVVKVGTPIAGHGGGDSKVFEPNDEYKGDFARAYFYMVTRYQDLAWDPDYPFMIKADSYLTLQPWAIDMLLEWSRNDPVSPKEINRNEQVYAIQNNRNPFIDYPYLAEFIWGTEAGRPFDPAFVPTTIEATGVTVTPAEAEVTEGETLTLSAEVVPANASSRTIVWSSSDTSIATVSGTGVVTTLKAGTVEISAKLVSNPAISGTCTITVLAAPAPAPSDMIEYWSDNSIWGGDILPGSSDAAGVTATYRSSDTGIAYTMYGVYRNAAYLMFNGKTYDSYIEFSLPINCDAIVITTSSTTATNANSKIDILAAGTKIVDGALVNEKSTDYTFEIPEDLREAGTVYRIARNNNKVNQQFAKFTFLRTPDPVENSTLSISPIEVVIGATEQVPVVLAHPDYQASALSFDVTLPEGLELESTDDGYLVAATERAASHTCAVTRVGSTHTVVLSHPENAVFTGNDGAILHLGLKATEEITNGEVSVTNIKLTDSEGKIHNLPDATAVVNAVSGIVDITIGSGSVEYFNLQGIRVEGELTPGYYIEVRNGKSRKVRIL